MAIKKRDSRISTGLTSSVHKRQEEKRQERFAKRKAAGKEYKWSKNPYKFGTNEWIEENEKRKQKAKSSKPMYAQLTSIFKKLDNQVNKEKADAAMRKQMKNKR